MRRQVRLMGQGCGPGRGYEQTRPDRTCKIRHYDGGWASLPFEVTGGVSVSCGDGYGEGYGIVLWSDMRWMTVRGRWPHGCRISRCAFPVMR